MRWILCLSLALLLGCSQSVDRGSAARMGGALTDIDVREVQELLNLNGYSAGPADGIVGPRTSGAIRAYQADYTLKVTGQPSRRLLAHLRAATAGELPAPDALQATGPLGEPE